MTSIEKNRAAFEAFSLENTDYDLSRNANGEYEYQGVQDMWEAWCGGYSEAQRLSLHPSTAGAYSKFAEDMLDMIEEVLKTGMSDEKLTPIPMREGISLVMGNQQDKERAEFERFYLTQFTVEKPSFNRYKNDDPTEYNCEDTQQNWETWQASAACSASRIAELEEGKDRAERALLRAGYTHLDGAQEWRPPIGPNPCHLLDRIAELEAEVWRLKAVITVQLSDDESITLEMWIEQLNDQIKDDLSNGASLEDTQNDRWRLLRKLSGIHPLTTCKNNDVLQEINKIIELAGFNIGGPIEHSDATKDPNYCVELLLVAAGYFKQIAELCAAEEKNTDK